MRIGLFYVSPLRVTPEHQLVLMPDGSEMFIRTEVVEVESEVEALDAANLLPGEAFMNSHSLNKEDYEE